MKKVKNLSLAYVLKILSHFQAQGSYEKGSYKQECTHLIE